MPDQKTIDRLCLPSNKTTDAIGLIVCLGFVGCGVWEIASEKAPLVVWVSIVFFILGIPLYACRLLFSRQSHLLLTHDGFEMRTLGQSTQIKWGDVETFKVVRIPPIPFSTSFVGFNFSEDFKRNSAQRPKINKVGGIDGILPETYGKKPQELADLMNHWKASNYETDRNSPQ